jgi:serine/threonine-protein kinase
MSTVGLQVGSQFGPYLLKRLIGQGGMGQVWEAYDSETERPVALKVLLPGFSADAEFRSRLQREARIAGRLQEPHVVPIHRCGEIDGQCYVDMRLIDGTDLHTTLSRYGPMPPARAVAIVRQIAAALDAAHAAGVIHRDVKPENVLITADDFAYLADFGLANAATELRFTQLGTAVGTWAYMAPERFAEAEVTYKADIYALACVLFEALTGVRPFPAQSVQVVVNAHLNEDIPRPHYIRPSVPAEFDEVIARGMAKNPEDRYATAGDLALAAQDALDAAEFDRAAGGPGASQVATMPPVGITEEIQTMPAQPGWQPTQMAPAGYNPGAGYGAAGSYPRPSGPQPFGPAPSGPQPYPSNPPAQPYGQIPSGPQPFGPVPGAGPQFPPGPPTPWSPSGPPPLGSHPPKKRGPWLALGIVALVLVLALGAFGIWRFTRGGGQATVTSSPSTTTSASSATPTTTTPAATAFNADESTLLDDIRHGGFTSDLCTPTRPPEGDSIATLTCHAVDRGPTSGTFWLYQNAALLKQGFTGASGGGNKVEPVPCPGHTAADPVPWHYNKSPTVDAGVAACGKKGKDFVVIWTEESDLLLGVVHGNALEPLYNWWNTYA